MRKPIQIEMQGGKSRRQHIWEEILRQKGACFGLTDITPGDVSIETTRDYVKGLSRAGYLTVIATGKAPRTVSVYQLTLDVGIEAPRVKRNGDEVTQGQGNEAIWGAMRALGSFNTLVLAQMAGVKESTVKSYCTLLHHAGYLTVDKQGKGTGRGGIATQYRLLMSKVNGPRPPMITRLKAVYDPNIHAFTWQQNADEVLEELEGIGL